VTASIINSPYLRTTRDFPKEHEALRVELNKMYIDLANGLNARTAGLFPTNRPAISGEEWFLSSQKQQGLRQVYPITGAGSYAHGITLSNISGFTKIYGVFVDMSGVWYPLPYVDVVAANNQVNVIVNGTNIVVAAGGGSPPSISSGLVVLEWLSFV
jgi:hypothetical protein